MDQMELFPQTETQRDEPTLTLLEIEHLHGLFERYKFEPNALLGVAKALEKAEARLKLRWWLIAKGIRDPSLFA